MMAWRCKEHQFAERILNSLPMLIARIEPLSGYQLPPTRPDGNAISWMFSTALIQVISVCLQRSSTPRRRYPPADPAPPTTAAACLMEWSSTTRRAARRAGGRHASTLASVLSGGVRRPARAGGQRCKPGRRRAEWSAESDVAAGAEAGTGVGVTERLAYAAERPWPRQLGVRAALELRSEAAPAGRDDEVGTDQSTPA